MMKALVTRPADDAVATAAALTARGIEPVLAPMLTIEPAAPDSLSFAGVQAVLVTSRNGIRALAEATTDRSVRLLCVGEASAALGREAGFSDVATADGDAGDLARLAARHLDPAGGPLVHAAGAEAGDALPRALKEKGFAVEQKILYKAVPAASVPAPVQDLMRDGRLALALFFSARTAETFTRLVKSAGLEDYCNLISAIFISERAATAASVVGWRSVDCAARPNQAALFEAVDRVVERSLASRGKCD